MVDTKKYSNAELAAMAVARLNGRSIPVELEDIAMELFAMASSRFSLRKYPQHVDSNAVRVSLSDAQRRDPPLLVGGIKEGYLLSPEGIRWLDSLQDAGAETKDNDSPRKGSYLHTLDAEKVRLCRTKAYTAISQGLVAEVKLNDLYEFLRVNEYFPDKKVKNRIRVIENVANEDNNIRLVWEKLKELYSKELSRYEG